MKQRTKVVLEGALLEITHNEYDRYLDIDDLLVQIDSQQYLGSVTKEEAEQCKNILGRVKELKDEEMTLLQTLNRVIFNMIRPEVKEEEKSDEPKQLTIEDMEQIVTENDVDAPVRNVEEPENKSE